MNARPAGSTDRTPRIHDARGRALRELRLSVIDACNFRCGYCMPADKVADDHGLDAAKRLSFDEMEILVRGFARLGVDKLRLTGGEPLLRKNLPQLVARLASVPGIDDLALTTNGSLLEANAAPLFQAGLRRITVSLDALDADLFRTMSGGRGDVATVLAGMHGAVEAGFNSLKVNCVIQRGVNEDQVLPLVEYFRETGHVLRFIEYMDVGSCNGWRREQVVASEELRHRVDSKWPLHRLAPQHAGEVARRYGFNDGAGEIGFISSVTHTFCGDCERARVTADGHLYTCLFATQGTSLRGAVARGEAAVVDALTRAWSVRDDRYSELRTLASTTRAKPVEMFLIGG